MVINLSRKCFTVYEFQLFNKGLNFCPTPGYYNKNELTKDFNNFARKIKLKAYFGSKPRASNEFKPETNSTWEPPYTHHTVKTFLDAVGQDLENNTDNNKISNKQNLTKEERKALNNLRNRDDIIISQADKGGAIVIINVEDYIAEAERQLNDTTFYHKLDNNPTLIYNERVNNAIDNLKKEKEIPEKLAKSLKTVEPNTPKFYTLPKIHKENNPGRPVVNTINSHTSKISQLVDYHIQPLAQRLPSYTKDTGHFLRKLDNIKDINAQTILVTLDVRSLYTCIPNEEGVDAVKEAISNSPDSKVSSKVITTFIWLILTLSNFIFNGVNYLQKQGVSMGSIFSPSYANIFMGSFEKKHIYPRIRGKCKLYTRFIDDIFMIWNGSENALKKFLKEMNTVHSSIKFDSTYSFKEINFLDTVVYKDANNNLQTKLYSKPTDRTSFLHHNSEHPTPTKTSIIYSQALRVKRICSEKPELDNSYSILKDKFTSRGFKDDEIESNIGKANIVPREDLLIVKDKQQGSTKTPFVVTYNRTLPNIRTTLNKHWNTLSINKGIAEKFKDKPIVAFRRNKNLKDLIGGTTIENDKVKRQKTTKGKSSSCDKDKRSKCCKQVVNTTKFKSSITKRTYNIREKMHCKDTWLVYLLTCMKCLIQYTGKTEWPFNQRLNKHRFDVNQEVGPAVDKHFALPGHNFERDARFILIEKLKNLNGDKDTLRKRIKTRENFWIKELETLHPRGLNMELNNI